MEAERLKGKVIIKQRHETLANANKDQEKPMVVSHSSFSKPNTSVSSSMIKQKSPQEVKKRKIPRKPKSLNSKAKQDVIDFCSNRFARESVVSDNRQNASYERKKTRRTTFDDLYNSIEAKFTVMERAGVVLENLSAESPSFVKCMLPSNVAHGFWLFLPKEFCDYHLPSHDTTVILVDEFGDEYKTKYLLERHGLSGGWRAFSIAHRLLKGDLLVFHLVGPCKLKVSV
ncbi:unnamed protein product [Ilex paraguariensis]|uniref:TF-B3 domain-containing protein n=1 Tax=Ilex paraguariensis TaxID=185542 RepID=A0ABC8UJP2_9AQUA